VVQYNTGVGEDFEENGWGRCRICKSFLHRKSLFKSQKFSKDLYLLKYNQILWFSGNHVFFQSNCFLNRIGKDRIRVRRLKKEAAQNKNEREEKDAKIARLEANLLDFSQIVERRESEGRAFKLNNTLKNEDENNLLSRRSLRDWRLELIKISLIHNSNVCCQRF